jgi:4-hydroxybenzoate polyprenyltransferase
MNPRTLLVLGRVSNLPTVWSNLLAGWLLNGGNHDLGRVALLLLGGSFLYIGGMFLNDFCDASFDRHYCSKRPIPAGKISRRAVGILSFLWFVIGLACLAPLGVKPSQIALVLTLAIVLYDFCHKGVPWAPWLMGFCRFLLYPLAAESVPFKKFDFTLFNVDPLGAALGFYVIGITYLARGESRPGKPARWALILLLQPLLVGAERALNWRESWPGLALAGSLQLAWMAWLLTPLWRKSNPSIGRVVSGLLAGIVLVDIVAVAPLTGFQAAWLLPLFFLALLLQRVIPAT